MDNSKYKIGLCKYYSSPKGCDNGNKCSFAHGKDEIIKKKCLNGIKCWNENCIYNHPKDWNPENNKKECFICYKYDNICNKENSKYKHIVDNDYNIDIKGDKNINSDISINKEFPEIIKNIKLKEINKDLEIKYSDILKSNLTNYGKNKTPEDEKLKEIDNSDNEINVQKIKKQLEDKYILLTKIDNKDWGNYEEIDNIQKDINILEDKYNKIKNANKSDIFENDINLDFIFNGHNDEHENISEEELPNINVSINILEDNNFTKNINETKELIEKIVKKFTSYNRKIKQDINNNIKNDDFKIILINNLNEILSGIILFKNNYEDITNIR